MVCGRYSGSQFAKTIADEIVNEALDAFERISMGWKDLKFKCYLRNSSNVVSIGLGSVPIEHQTLARPRVHCYEK